MLSVVKIRGFLSVFSYNRFPKIVGRGCLHECALSIRWHSNLPLKPRELEIQFFSMEVTLGLGCHLLGPILTISFIDFSKKAQIKKQFKSIK